MTPWIVYHPSYHYRMPPDHVFPGIKYQRVADALQRLGLTAFHTPLPDMTRAHLLAVHIASYLDQLYAAVRGDEWVWLTPDTPVNAELFQDVLVATAGTYRAADLALLNRRVGINLHGGFHHAFADHGEGFCLINDVAVAIRRLQDRDLIQDVLIVDCDVHQGNGTAMIFADDPHVTTLSIHERENYPYLKTRSTLDVEVETGSDGDAYLDALMPALDQILDIKPYHLAFYLAGADPYVGDQLGGLRLLQEDLHTRDLGVFERLKDAHTPVAVVLAGGYAESLDDLVQIHVNTVLAARETWGL